MYQKKLCLFIKRKQTLSNHHHGLCRFSLKYKQQPQTRNTPKTNKPKLCSVPPFFYAPLERLVDRSSLIVEPVRSPLFLATHLLEQLHIILLQLLQLLFLLEQFTRQVLPSRLCRIRPLNLNPVHQRWVIAIKTKIQLPNTLPIILNCVIGIIN